ncbi:hypothetical protein [Bacillus sp. AK128]
MRLELPVRLRNPLYLCVIFIFISGLNFFDTLELGFWKYIIGIILFIPVMWILEKSGLAEKEVPIWVGAFIIILGFSFGFFLDTLIVNSI